MVKNSIITITTQGGRGLFDITQSIRSTLAAQRVETGLCHIFVHHTSASLIITENFDPRVQDDLADFMAKLVPDGDPAYRHHEEGPDDMASHIRSILTQTSLAIPIKGGRLDLGTWQAVYLWEHRYATHQRRITLTFMA